MVFSSAMTVPAHPAFTRDIHARFERGLGDAYSRDSTGCENPPFATTKRRSSVRGPWMQHHPVEIPCTNGIDARCGGLRCKICPLNNDNLITSGSLGLIKREVRALEHLFDVGIIGVYSG